jgi:hypothetical protein
METKSTEQYLTELLKGDPDNAYNKHMDYGDRWKFGLTLKHMWNRLTTASITGSTLENTRAALVKTVQDCDTMNDIAFLRRDASAGLQVLAKRADNIPAERNAIEVHLKWMRGEYRDMMNARAKQIQGK